MSLTNIYLGETRLTSTKNKYLQHNVLTDSLEGCEPMEPLRKKIKKGLIISPKCLTENKILLESNFNVWKDDDIKEKKKKKKKKGRLMTRSHFRSRSRSVERCILDVIQDFSECDSVPCDDSMHDSTALSPPKLPIEARLLADLGDIPANLFGARSAVTLSVLEAASEEASDQSLLFGRIQEANIRSAPSGKKLCKRFALPPQFQMQAKNSAFAAAPGRGFTFGSASGTGFALGSAPGGGFPIGGVPGPAYIAETFISKMPTYELEILKLSEEKEEFFSLNISASYTSQHFNPREKKMELLNTVSMALTCSSNLKKKEDEYRKVLTESANIVRSFDPEFILKVALYARQELHLRTVTNFLLSYAALHENTRFCLEKYFEAAIVLPSDWIQVAEYYQALNAGSPKQSFPAVLRRAMKKTFTKFDKYQLAKYNKNKSKKKSKKNKSLDAEDDKMEDSNHNADDSDSNEKSSDDEDIIKGTADDVSMEGNDDNMRKKATKPACAYTLKKLIRILHIDSPSEHVMSLLGKKYPENYEAFKSSGLPGTWDSSKAGMRLKLPVPETWETKLSSHGNIPKAWESLIDNKKLPYMATLRNLRNLILSGISPLHHKKVIQHLENKTAVMNSRQLPMQFFEAYKVVSDLENMLDDKTSSECLSLPKWCMKRLEKTKAKLHNASVSLIKQYKNAISKALEISSLTNLHPVPGKTVVICIINGTDISCENKMKLNETCIMMGLMCLKACEDCKLNILGISDTPDVISLNENDSFLDVMMETCERYRKLLTHPYSQTKGEKFFALEKITNYYLRYQTVLSLKLDHVIVLDNSTISCQRVMSSFLHKYRQMVNPNLLYTNASYFLKSGSFSDSCLNEKDAFLSGSSSSLIKFIAERSNGGQVAYVDNIDMKYNLPKILESKKIVRVMDKSLPKASPKEDTVVPILCKLPKWHTVRIFISSTFKDMMSERDLLVRYVFPELRRRAASVFVRIVEIDLRWGITEADSATQRAAELCLLEAQKADFFIGLIGERYGTIYDFGQSNVPELQWVKDYSHGLSITELEMHAAALRDPESSRERAFFYFRDKSFSKDVPKKWISHFESEDLDSKDMVKKLKNQIRTSNFKILHGYPCHWAGIYEDKPILGGLDVLGKTVLDDLWEAVQKVHKRDPYYDTVEEEEIYQQNLINSQNFYVGEKNFPVENIVKRIKNGKGIFVIYGCPGSGKTTFSVKLLQHLKDFAVIKFFIGLSPRSRDLSHMLQYICNSICHALSISIPLPDLPSDIVNQFPDILMEAAKCNGGSDIILLIDGLDHLEKDDQTLDWLPLSLPDGVKLVFTVSESSEAFKVLNGRHTEDDIVFEELPLLQQSDREEFVRDYVKYYSKTFDESTFSNHMLMLVTKNDSSNPFYLHVVCDFLRIYATFENLESVLQKLPSAMTLLFQEIILQMENEFGSTLVQTVFILLCITKEGFEDNDLHFILSFVMHMSEMKTSLPFSELREKMQSFELEHLLCQVKYCSIMYVINTFAHATINGQKCSSLVGTEFEKAVKKFYLNKNYDSQSTHLHTVLAGYYYNMCDCNNDGMYSGQSGHAVRSLLYHMFHGNLFKELCDLLYCHKFLEAVFRTNVGPQLLEYYVSLLYDVLPSNQKISRQIDSCHLFSFYDFVSRNFHIFHQHPQLVMQQAFNEPSDSVVRLKKEDCTHNFLENLSRSQLLDYRLATFCGFIKNITASAGEKKEPLVVLGSEDGYLKVLDLSTRKIVRSIKGHLSAITSIKFVGKNRLCASSVDGTLSLWNSVDFSRIAVLKGHRHTVTCCCGDPSGSVLYSSGWDNSVRLWSLVDGRSISVIDEFRCPVNCITHHPTKQQIACGLWSGNIEIWDTVSMQRILGFPSFSGSVKSLAYTPDGINIISSFFDSEISIWSSEEGLKVSSLEGHILPVKSLSFSYDESIFVSGSDDCTLKVWSSVQDSNFSTISDCKFCPISIMHFLSENLLAVAFQNSEIWIIDINGGNVTGKMTLASDSVSVFSKYSFVALKSKDSENTFTEKLVVFGTEAGKIMIGDLLTSSISQVDQMQSKITAITHNCDLIFCGTAGGDIGVFTHPNESSCQIMVAAHRGFITSFSLALKEEELFVLSTANDNVMKLWNMSHIDSGIILHQERFHKHNDSITYSLFYPYHCDSSLFNNLLTGSHDNNIILWNEDSVKELKGLHSSIVNITCSGDYILGCSNDGAVVMWSQNGKIITSIPGIKLSSATLTFFVAEDDFNKFKVILAFVDQDGSIKISKPLQKTYSCSFEGHSKPITSCCTTENGDVISCSLDGSVNLWKVPNDYSDISLMHSSLVTGMIVSLSLGLVISGDAHGNLILWKTNLVDPSLPLIYAGKKSYASGFIKALSWLKGDKFVCAGNQVTGNVDENYFLHIINLEHSKENPASVFNFQVEKSFYFECEVSCLDSCSSTDTIVVGLKSGYAVVIVSGTQHERELDSDWLLGVQLCSNGGKSDMFCTADVNGVMRFYDIQNIINDLEDLFFDTSAHAVVYSRPSEYKQKFTTSSLYCSEYGQIYCGDSDGVLRIYSKCKLKFIEKIHSDAISGLNIIGPYLFTSSLDKSVKGWDLNSYKQICQFYSSVPISCLASSKIEVDACEENSCYLLIGTTSGGVQMLKFHHK